MLDIDYAPGVFAVWILLVLIAPAIYGATLVDAFWKKNKAEASADDDAFN